MADWTARITRRFRSPRDYLDAARSPEADADLLAGLATLDYPFVREAVAAHPNTTARTLLTLVPGELRTYAQRSLLRTILAHPSVDDEIVAAAFDRVRESLSRGERPYGSAIALARYAAIPREELLELGTLPGASGRLRRGLRRALGDAGH